MIFSWQWWTLQAMSFVALVLVVISYQQKTPVRLLWYRTVATWITFVAFCIFGQITAIILCGAGVIRNAFTMYFAYRPKTNINYKYVASVFLIALIITLNTVFWVGWYSLLGMAFGISMIIAFMQKDAKTIRKIAIVVGILGITFYGFLLSPMNVAIESFGLISAIVGIFRFDIKRGKGEQKKNLS